MIQGGDKNRKILFVEFTESEEAIFQQTIEWLSCKSDNIPKYIKQSNTEFHLDPFTRTFVNEKGENIFLKAKSLIYYISCIPIKDKYL